MSGFSLLVAALVLSLVVFSKAGCPKTMPIEIEGYCYRLQFDPLRWNDARDNCGNLESGAMMTSYKTEAVLKKIEELVYDFITSKLEKALFWIGLKMDDTSMSKEVQDRLWSWDYDDSKIAQKNYTLWDTEGGPTNKGLSCSTLNASNDFLVQAVDCGGPRLPVICMMEDGKTCTHDVIPYLMYGDYCIASLNGALEYNKIHGACSPESPTPYKEEMREYVIMAAKNSFLGGGVFMNIRRNGWLFYELSDGSVPPDDMWEEGEPRDQYDCVGLSLQPDNTLKLKTIHCDFMAASLCIVESRRRYSIKCVHVTTKRL